jgi:hypothetical protein
LRVADQTLAEVGTVARRVAGAAAQRSGVGKGGPWGLEMVEPGQAVIGALPELELDGLGEMALVQNEQERRIYPWGPEADPNRANYRDTGIGDHQRGGLFSGWGYALMAARR